jgi:hypothetical protein
MLKRFFALLFVLAALSGGIYALHGSKKGPKRPKTDDASLDLRRYEPYFSTSPASTAVATSHVVALVAAALVLGTAAYFGLGQTLEAGAIPTTTTSTTMKVTPEDDVRSFPGRFQSEFLHVAASPQPAPPAAPVAEAVLATPAPVDPPTAAPTPEPVVDAYVPAVYPEGSFEAIICALPWPCNQAIAVASCESGLDRSGHLDGNWATNGNYYGLFQIGSIHAWRWPDFWDAWMDPARNAQYAYDIWSESGWRPWSCQP